MGVCARGGDGGCFPPQGSQAPVLRFRPPGGQKGVRRCPRHRPGQGGGGREGSWTHLGRRALVTSAASTGYAQTKASPARVQPGIPGPASAVPGPRSIHGRRAQGRTLHPSKVTQSSAAGAARRFCPAAGSGERPAPSLSAPAASAVTVAARASEVCTYRKLHVCVHIYTTRMYACHTCMPHACPHHARHTHSAQPPARQPRACRDMNGPAVGTRLLPAAICSAPRCTPPCLQTSALPSGHRSKWISGSEVWLAFFY